MVDQSSKYQLVLLAVLASLSHMAQAAPNKTIAVVGAGVAGLAAARKLQDSLGDEYNIVVLEANPSRYGGRIHTDSTTFAGSKIDLGASWIHGSSSDHAVTQLVNKYGIRTVTTDEDEEASIVFKSDSQEYTGAELEEGYEEFEEITTKLALAQYDTDISVRAAITREGLDARYQQPLALFYASSIETSYGASLSDLSVKATVEDGGLEEEGDYGEERVFPDGYVQVLEVLKHGGTTSDSSKTLNIVLDHKVTKVSVDEQAGSVTLTFASGDTMTVDRVIMTVSLGVLKAGDITFEPQLSALKREAIQKIGFGVLDKLVLEFDEVFWPEDIEYFNIAPAEENDYTGLLNHWMALNKIVNKPILVGFIGGKAAPFSEQMLSDGDLQAKGIDKLNVMFGNDTVKPVKSMARTKWLENEFTKGSYSYAAVGTTEELWEALAKPEGDTPLLFFAGEHTYEEEYATVLAGYVSGQRAADEVIKSVGGGAPCHQLLSPLAAILAIVFFYLSK